MPSNRENPEQQAILEGYQDLAEGRVFSSSGNFQKDMGGIQMTERDIKVLDMHDIRQAMVLSAPDVDFDVKATFYYDETNNIRKFYVREADFNESFTSNFVLGGLLHESSAPDVQPLITSLRLQPTVKEIKFRHIASGNFLECLKANKLRTFLQFIKESNLYVHYSSTNILYWSIVDIVDSAIAESDVAMSLGLDFANHLKNDLYKLSRLEIESVISLFRQYKYPNISSALVCSFVEDLSRLFESYINTFEFHFGLESLRQILKVSKKKSSLPFIEGGILPAKEDDYILIHNFFDFYLRPVYMLKNSTHIFDKEDSISEVFSGYQMLDGGIEVKNYSFVDSQSDIFVQLSDVLVGIMGKLHSYANLNSKQTIEKDIASFSSVQKENLNLLQAVIKKSLNKNTGFIHRIDAYEELSKTDSILGL